MSAPKKKSHKIFVLSGGTGRTAEGILRATLEQFPDRQPEIFINARVRSEAKAIEMVREAATRKAAVCHSLVETKIRLAVDNEARRLGVPCVDVLGPAISLLGDYLSAVPQGRPGLLSQVHREQFARIDAMDFTLAHDDGQRLDELKWADVVLIGASRTSKSVTCFYLAFRGIWAANVPLIPGIPSPKQLKKLNSSRVIGLTMNAAHLESVRQSRMERLSERQVPQYANLRDIQQELRRIRELISSNGWASIDVSYKATEEVADQILEMLPRRRSRKPASLSQS